MSGLTSRFLLRMDDLCPTMSRSGWARFEALIEEFSLRPILAVVPDNHDPELVKDSPDPEFWKMLRALESRGATVALHGYRHICSCRGRALMPLHTMSEFAGIDDVLQQEWIHAGVDILRGHGLRPRLFVAPRHGFDFATLKALRAAGLSAISDGYGTRPFRFGGVTWIPQQLWGPAERQTGIWTICIHPNTTCDAATTRLHEFLRRKEAQFTSVDEVLAESGGAVRGLLGLGQSAGWARWRRMRTAAQKRFGMR